MATDITERKQAQEALNRLNDTLEQRISERTMALRESEERLRLAQQAAHIGTFEWNLQTGTSTWTPQLEALYGLAPGEFGRTQYAWEQRWRSIRESAVQLADDMHHFAYRLHPSTLEHLGLEAALRDHITEFAQRTGLDVQYVVRNVPGTIRIEQATCLYRITQESLQNVYKHAGASSVLVRISRTIRGVGVCIYDNWERICP